MSKKKSISNVYTDLDVNRDYLYLYARPLGGHNKVLS